MKAADRAIKPDVIRAIRNTIFRVMKHVTLVSITV
jgi:hypothetical protein